MRTRLGARRDRGIALVIVMLVVFVLAAIAGGFAYSMRVEMRLARNSNYDADLEWLGRSGVELARFVIAEQAKIPNEGSYEALNQKWAGGLSQNTNSTISDISLENYQLGAGTISVKIIDQERKFNINLADDAIIRQALLLMMGVDASSFPEVVDSILDWIDLDNDPHLGGAESDYYLGLTPAYSAKNGLIDNLSELLMIKGITPEMYWGTSSGEHPVTLFHQPPRKLLPGDQPSFPVGLVDLFTTMSSGRININTASVDALQMIPDIDINTAQNIIKLRAGPDGVEGNEDDVPFRNAGELVNVPGLSRQTVQQLTRYCDVRSHTFEVQVNAEINGARRKFTAVLRRNNSNVQDLQMLFLHWN
jgi:general secretion pathway protein K